MAVRLQHTHVSPSLDSIDYDSQPEPSCDFYEPEYGYQLGEDEMQLMARACVCLENLNKTLPFRRIDTTDAVKDVSSRIKASAVSIDGRLKSRG